MNTRQSIVDDLNYKLHSSYGLACPDCGTPLPSLPLNVQNYERYTCEFCQVNTHLWDWSICLIEEHHVFSENPESVRDLVFYHATTRKNWWDNLPKSLLIHFGSQRAAYERARNMGFLEDANGFDVFTLKIKPDAEIYEGLLIDECADRSIEKNEIRVPSEIGNLRYRGIEEATVFRYVNEWEAPGSISMVAIKSSLEIVDKQPSKKFFG